MQVRKAVIPVAGFGTRFLPATRAVPKVLVPVLDTPPIHFAVQEAVDAGIQQVVIVMSPQHDAIKTYFEGLPELEPVLRRQGKEALLQRMEEISDMADISYVYQPEAQGLGHAILLARDFVGDEPFAVFLPDDVIWDESPTIGQMLEVFGRFESSVIALKEVADEQVPSLGIVDPVPLEGRIYEVTGLVEKPSPAEAPSNLAIIGRYVLTPQVFAALESTRPGALGEIQVTDGIAALLPAQKVYAYRFPGVHFDVGTPIGLLRASVHAALQREDMADGLKAWLSGVL